MFTSRILSVETHEECDGGVWSCYAAVTVRVFTQDAKDMGHEDTGTHTLTGPNRFELMRNVKESAVANAKERAMSIFGHNMGTPVSEESDDEPVDDESEDEPVDDDSASSPASCTSSSDRDSSESRS